MKKLTISVITECDGRSGKVRTENDGMTNVEMALAIFGMLKSLQKNYPYPLLAALKMIEED